jgi:hypothetical protein
LHNLQYVMGIRKAPRVSATHVHIGYIVPILGDPFANSLDAPLRIIEANVEDSGKEGSVQRSFYRGTGPVACQRCLDSEALPGSKVFQSSAKNLLSG